MRIYSQNIVMEECEMVFILVCKVAASSIKVALNTSRVEKKQEVFIDSSGARMPIGIHGKFQYIDIKTVCNDYKNFWKVTFVRNPWDRVVSTWMNKTITKLHNKFADWGCWLGMPFEEYVNIICNDVSDEIADHHVMSQYRIMYYNNIFVPDYVVKFEKLNEGWDIIRYKAMQKNFAIPALDIWNTTQHPHYRELYTEETKKLVEKRYSEDIVRFGYEY